MVLIDEQWSVDHRSDQPTDMISIGYCDSRLTIAIVNHPRGSQSNDMVFIGHRGSWSAIEIIN